MNKNKAHEKYFREHIVCLEQKDKEKVCKNWMELRKYSNSIYVIFDHVHYFQETD